MSKSRTSEPAALSLPAMNGPGPSLQQLLDQERGDVPPVLRDASAVDLGTDVIARERYFDPAFLQQEYDQVWSRVWQTRWNQHRA